MKAARIRISNDATLKLRRIQSKTGLTPNILLRIGFGISLREKTPISPSLYREDGKELNRYTITGEFDEGFVALLKEWLVRNDKTLDNKNIVSYFRAHMNRGAVLVSARIKSLTDLALLD